MTTSFPEEVANDKIQSVPSFKEVAISPDINETYLQDLTHEDKSIEPTLAKNAKLVIDPPVSEIVNGDTNAKSPYVNQSDLTTPLDKLSQSKIAEPSDSFPSAPQSIEISPDLDKATIDNSFSASPETLPTSVDSVNQSDIKDIPITISTTLAVEAEQSSLHGLDEVTQLPLDESLANLDVSNNQADKLQKDNSAMEGALELCDFFQEGSAGIHEASNALDPHTQTYSNSPTENPDLEMTDAPQLSSKTSREREDDDEMEPSAKRPKINDDSIPSDSITQTSKDEEYSHNSQPEAVKEEETSQSQTLTAFQIKELIKILRNIARTNAGKNFRQPVAVLWPTIADNYAAKIPNPMDLSTIEKKLKDEAYATISDIKADVHLIYNNSVIFNSAENPVSKCAMETRNALFNKFSTIPPEPTPAPKKEKKAAKRSSQVTDTSTRAPTNSRRYSRDSHPAPVYPIAKPSSQAFALDPTTNTPLIRRDSSKVDGGRPKREIHPPKNKDLPYAVRPKNKKHLTELKFCDETLSELQKPKYNSISHPFMIPVDPVALGIPNYFAIIKKPMDISTVSKKLKDGAYINANEFEKDIRQIFTNCYKYNPEGNPVRQMGQSFEEIFNNFWSKKDQYLADNSPSAVSLSDRDSDEEDSEDDEGLDGAAVAASLMSQKERLLEEQSKLINMMGAKHKDEGLLQMQTDLVELIQKRVRAAEEQAKKTLNKKKATRVSKKTAPTKKSVPPKKVGTKKKYLGTLEKETISAGLGLLPAQIMGTVVDMIKTERPELADAGDETMELDIDSISDTILWQIHVLIMKHVPELEGQIRESMSSEPRHALRTAKPAAKKKNKPMSKHEQERKIEALTNLNSEFARASFGSQDPTSAGLSNYGNPSHLDTNIALDPESSGDEDSDSEEE